MAFHANIEDCVGYRLDVDAVAREHTYRGNGSLPDLDDTDRAMNADTPRATPTQRLCVPFGFFGQRKA